MEGEAGINQGKVKKKGRKSAAKGARATSKFTEKGWMTVRRQRRSEKKMSGWRKKISG